MCESVSPRVSVTHAAFSSLQSVCDASGHFSPPRMWQLLFTLSEREGPIFFTLLLQSPESIWENRRESACQLDSVVYGR